MFRAMTYTVLICGVSAGAAVALAFAHDQQSIASLVQPKYASPVAHSADVVPQAHVAAPIVVARADPAQVVAPLALPRAEPQVQTLAAVPAKIAPATQTAPTLQPAQVIEVETPKKPVAKSAAAPKPKATAKPKPRKVVTVAPAPATSAPRAVVSTQDGFFRQDMNRDFVPDRSAPAMGFVADAPQDPARSSIASTWLTGVYR